MFGLLLRISWRNIWRNKRRSVIVMSSVAAGVIAVILLDGLNGGMINQMLLNQINSGVSHIQIHKKGFEYDKTVQSFIPDYKKAEQIISKNPSVKVYSKRVISYGLLSSATNSSGVMINGIIPQNEEKMTDIKSLIKQGDYLSGEKREIIIGKSLAEKLDVGIGDKVVSMASTPDGNVSSEVFRIKGIFESYSTEFDRVKIFISINDAQKLLETGDNIHELAIITKDFDKTETVKDEIISQLNGEYEVLSYKDILPMFILSIDLYKQMMLITNAIVGAALIFGIINVMLMAVMERIREFGVLMSIGMKNSKLISMIMTEAFIIGIIGTAAGIIAGILIHIPLSESGINLSMFAESLRSYGVGAVIYPEVSAANLISIIIMIPFISVIAAIYPAYKASRTEPIDAIRHV